MNTEISILKCKYCDKPVERKWLKENASCFDCKRKLQKEKESDLCECGGMKNKKAKLCHKCYVKKFYKH